MRNFFHFCLCLFFVLAAGCSGYRIEDCNKEQAAYIAASLDWVEEHGDIIEQSMSDLWPQHRGDVATLLATLSDTPITCGVGREEGDAVAATTVQFPREKIVVDISHPVVTNGLRMYNESLYVMDYSFEELADPNVIDPRSRSSSSDVLNYHYARSDLGHILLHEGAHVLLGAHSHQTKQMVERLPELDPSVTGTLDEIYGWGAAVAASTPTILEPDWEALSEASEQAYHNVTSD